MPQSVQAPLSTLTERIARLDPEPLTAIGKVVLQTLAAFADRYTGENVWVSEGTVQELTGFSRTAIKAAYRHLHRIGALVYAMGGRRPRMVDSRVPQRAIVIEHLVAKAPRRGRWATQFRPPTGSPTANELGRGKTTTFPCFSPSEKNNRPAPESPLMGADPVAEAGGSSTEPTPPPATPWGMLLGLLLEHGLVPDGNSPAEQRAWLDLLRSRGLTQVGRLRAALTCARARLPRMMNSCSPRSIAEALDARLEPVLA